MVKLRRHSSSALLVAAIVVAGVVATGCQAHTTVLAGQVTSTNSTAPNVAGVPVVAYSDSTETPVASTVTGSDGAYAFSSTALADGTYRLRIGEDYWWSGATSWTTASAVTVNAATTSTADATVDLASGALTGTVDNGSDPLAGIVVLVAQKTTGEPVAMAETGPNGRYVFPALYPQLYSLSFADPSQNMRGALWGAQSEDPTSGFGFPVFDGRSNDVGTFGLTGHDCIPGRSYVDASLAGANLENCDLSHIDLSGADFTGAGLANADLTAARMTGTQLAGADFTGATLHYVVSGDIVGSPTSLPNAWVLVDGYLIGPGASLQGAQLDSADLAGTSLQFARLVDASMHDADLTGANLGGADLAGVDLNGTNLTGVTLDRATLTGANLDGADLTDATLTYVRSGAIVGAPAALPADWTLTNGYLIGPGASLPGAQLDSANLSGASLPVANLNGATLQNADLSNADVRGLQAPNANFAGADLSGTDLVNSNFTGADLSGADLTNANLDGADLSGATLTGVVSGGITGTPAALPVGWSLVNGELVGPPPAS